MQTLTQTPSPVNPLPYVTLSQARGARAYRPIYVDARGTHSAPVHIRHATLRNVLAVAMTYAQYKGFPFRIEPDLLAEAQSVQAELAERGTFVEIDLPADANGLRDVSVTTPAGRYDLAVLPGEDAAQLAADADAVLAETEDRPWAGQELTQEEIDDMFGDYPDAMPAASIDDDSLRSLVEKALAAWPALFYKGGHNSRAHAAANLVEHGKVRQVGTDLYNVDGRLCSADADSCECEDHAFGAPVYPKVGHLCKHRLAARMARVWTGDKNEPLLALIERITQDAKWARLIVEWDYETDQRTVVGYEALSGRERWPGLDGIAFTWLQLRWALDEAGWGLGRLPEKQIRYDYILRLIPGRGIEISEHTMHVQRVSERMLENRKFEKMFVDELANDGNQVGVSLAAKTELAVAQRRAELAAA